MQKQDIEDLFKKYSADKDTPLYVTAVNILTESMKQSKATTMMGLDSDIKKSIEYLQQVNQQSKISIRSGCELFLRFVTRQSQEIQDFDECKLKLIRRGEAMIDISRKSQDKVVKYFENFIRDGMTILVFGYDHVVNSILIKAKEQNRFNVIVTECRPNCEGYRTAGELTKHGIPVTLIVDSSVARIVNTIDFILTGAEGVVENGGIINTIGTYQLAIVAKQHRKPFYIASESFKFTREYPLTQTDIVVFEQSKDFVPVSGESLENVQVLNHQSDFTPPALITLLFTDLGILTPNAVSDELIKLYY